MSYIGASALILSLQKIDDNSYLVHGERVVKLKLLLKHRLMHNMLLDTFVNSILGHNSMSEKLKSAHPVL